MLRVSARVQLCLSRRRIGLKVVVKVSEVTNVVGHSIMNEEFGRMMYLISHDLQGPTRHIRSFVELLTAEFGDELEADAATYFDLIVGAADVLDAKVHDLTRYSRAVNHDYEFVACDGQAIVEAALASCRDELLTTGAEVTVGALPPVRADEQQLIDVIAELLHNSMKFSPDTPEIDITGVLEGTTAGVVVADRSAGLPSDGHERLFELYGRAHPRTVPGTGCGLTIARAVVRAHGGELTIAPRRGGGAIARVLLPA